MVTAGGAHLLCQRLLVGFFRVVGEEGNLTFADVKIEVVPTVPISYLRYGVPHV